MIFAIDPGQAGGLAWAFKNGRLNIWTSKMEKTPADIYNQIKGIRDAESEPFCYIERVGGYMPGNSGPAAVKFAKHCGHLEMALIALGIPYIEVLPSKWQHEFIGKPNYPKIPKEIQGASRKQILAKRKQERKNKIKAKAQALFPYLKITLATADALGILYYGLKQSGK